MPINPAIAMGVQPMQLADPLAQYGKFAAIQQAQSQNALAQYQLDAARRESEKAAALNALYAGAVTPEGGIDYNKLTASAAQQGMGALVPGILKGRREYEESAAKANEAFGKAVEQRMKVSRNLLEGVSTPEQYIAWHEANHRDPVLAKFFAERGITAEDARSRIQAAVAAGPQAFEQLLAESKIGAEKVAAQIAEANKPIHGAAGGFIYDPRTQTFRQAPAAPAKPTPGETEELVTRLQDPALTPQARSALEARLRILTTREPKEPKEPAIRTTKVELADGSIGVMNLDTGEITPATVGGQTAKGKPSAFAEKAAAQRKQLAVDLDRTITELENAAKPKGLIEQSTGSGAGRLVDIGAAFVGQATPGAIAAGKLAPIADMVLKMVPRFEGPQSDKDTKSYKEAAGQLADTTLPTKIRQSAALEIVRLMRARKNQFATADMAAEGLTPAPAFAPAPAPGGFPAPPQAAIDALKAGKGTDAQFDAIFGPGAAARARGR